MPDFLRYVLWQLPGWLIAGFLAFLAVGLADVPLWLGALALALFVGKDLVLYPALRVIFRSPKDQIEGAIGSAAETLEPFGAVLVHGQRWRAELSRGGMVPAGAAVRVVGVQGLTLLVEAVDEEAQSRA